MADIFIHENGEQRAFTEEQITVLFQSGLLRPDTLCWREGMADWEPLAMVFPPRDSSRQSAPLPLIATLSSRLPPVASRPADSRLLESRSQPMPVLPSRPDDPVVAASKVSGRRRFRFRRNPYPLTILLQVVLAGCMIVTALEWIHGASTLQSVAATPPAVSVMEAISETWNARTDDDGPTIPPHAKAPPQDKQEHKLGRHLQRAGWAAIVILLVPYFMWLHRTCINCRNFSSVFVQNPDWSVGVYFVPFLNFFQPCQKMQEVWKVSRNPRSWRNDRGSILVLTWWVMMFAIIFLAVESWWLAQSVGTRVDAYGSDLVFLALKSLQFIWYAIFLAMITLIIRKQEHLVAESKRTVGSGPSQ